MIWEATLDQLQGEQELAILKQRIYSKRLPEFFNLLDHSIDNVENILDHPVVNEDMRTTLLTRRSKMIAQFKYDMMMLTIQTIEERLRSHANIVSVEKNKFLTMNPTHSATTMMDLIKARRAIMRHHATLILQGKLSFFDNAPMDID